MYKKILSLKLNRNSVYTNPITICVFIVDDYLNISDTEKEMILDAIENKYHWIHSELSVNREYIKRKLLNSKWNTLEYINKDFKCKGKLFLEKIDSFGV